MAALDSQDSPPNVSFAIREPPSSTPTTPTSTRSRTHPKFLRSISNKEASFSYLPCTPPRLSSSSILAAAAAQNHLSSPTSPLSKNHHHLHSHDLSTYRCISSVLKKDGQILSMAISNGLVYTGSDTNVVRIWKLPEFTECGKLKTKASMVVAIQVCNDRVYAAYADSKIRVWRRTWDGALKHVRVATIPKAGGYVRSYIAGKDKKAKHMAPITSLAINISDDILYSSSLDKTVKVWRISDFKCTETIQAHSEPVNDIVLASDGVLYTASDDATVRVWRRNFCRGDQPHSLVITLPAKFSPVKTLTLTADGAILYGGCTDGYIHHWIKGWFSGQLQYGGALQGHSHAVMCMASVANFMISGSADSTSRVWVREQDGQHTCLAVLVGHRGPIRCIAAIPGPRLGEEGENGCSVCTGSLDGVLKVWRVTNSGNIQGSTQNGYEY